MPRSVAPGGGTLSYDGDTGSGTVDLDSQTFTIAGGDGIDTTASGQVITAAIDSTVVTLSDTQTLSNKTWNQGTIVLRQGTNPTQTDEGDIRWATTADQIRVGDGSSTVSFSDDSKLTLNASTDVSGNSWVLDEDDMASDDDKKISAELRPELCRYHIG